MSLSHNFENQLMPVMPVDSFQCFCEMYKILEVLNMLVCVDVLTVRKII